MSGLNKILQYFSNSYNIDDGLFRLSAQTYRNRWRIDTFIQNSFWTNPCSRHKFCATYSLFLHLLTNRIFQIQNFHYHVVLVAFVTLTNCECVLAGSKTSAFISFSDTWEWRVRPLALFQKQFRNQNSETLPAGIKLDCGVGCAVYLYFSNLNLRCIIAIGILFWLYSLSIVFHLRATSYSYHASFIIETVW